MSYLGLLAEDQELIVFRKSLLPLGGSVIGTLLLNQFIYWGNKLNGVPFYKFTAPCNHKLYSPGDSWTETLGITPYEFNNALKNFAFKLGKASKKKCEAEGLNYKEQQEKHIVTYFTDINRVTWYTVNMELLSKSINLIYNKPKKVELPNSRNSSSLVNEETRVTNQTETTHRLATETTTEKKTSLSSPQQAAVKNSEISVISPKPEYLAGLEDDFFKIKREGPPTPGFEDYPEYNGLPEEYQPLTLDEAMALTPEALRGAVRKAIDKFGGKKYSVEQKILEVMKHFPLGRAVNTLMLSPVTSPAAMAPFWSRWRNGTEQGTLEDSEFLTYVRACALYSLNRYVGGTIKYFFETHNHDQAEYMLMALKREDCAAGLY